MFLKFRAGWMFAAASLALAVSSTAEAKPYKGAEVYSAQSYLHGRMEMRMRMVRGSGILSTFFTYKNGSEMSGAFWEEIDIEVFGKDNARTWQSNIITGMGTRVTSEAVHTADVSLADGYHTYTLEWTPQYVAWSIDGREIKRSTGDQVAALKNPQSLRFNLWSSDATEWVGPFDDSVLPQHQYINWIKYYRYNNGAFELAWQDDFDSLDGARWSKGDWTFDGNRVDFDPQNVTVKDGTLVLSLTREGQTGFTGNVPRDEDTGPGTGAGGAATSSTSSSSTSGGMGGAGTTTTTSSGDGAGGADTTATTSSGDGAGGADTTATTSSGDVSGTGAATSSSAGSVGAAGTTATSSGSGDTSGEGGGPGGTTPDTGSSDDGCGCVVAGASTTTSSWAAALAVGLSALAMRRRRSRG